MTFNQDGLRVVPIPSGLCIDVRNRDGTRQFGVEAVDDLQRALNVLNAEIHNWSVPPVTVEAVLAA